MFCFKAVKAFSSTLTIADKLMHQLYQGEREREREVTSERARTFREKERGREVERGKCSFLPKTAVYISEYTSRQTTFNQL